MKRHWIIGVTVSVLAIALTWILPDFRLFQLSNVAYLAIAMLGLNMLTGFNGQISLGHGAFIGIGAYTVAITVREYGLSYPLAVVLAFVVTFAVGALIGIPALRLPGTSLALITLAMALAFPQVLKKFESVTGGVQGIGTPPERQFNSPWTSMTTDQFRYLIFAIIAIIMFWIGWNIVRGRWGLAMMSIRDNPVSAASMGVNLPAAKVVTFGLSSAFAGVGGALYFILLGFASPDSFGIILSIALLTGIVIGGLGTVAGAVIGGLFVQFTPVYAEEISQAAPGVVYGVIIILVMILAPGGVIGLLRRASAFVSRRRRGASTSETEAAVAAAEFPTAVDDPVPTASSI